MGDNSVKQRNEIDKKYKWSIETMYNMDFVWERDYCEVKDAAEELAGYKGRLGESAETLLEFLDKRSAAWRTLEHLYVYARMKRDEDNREPKYQALCEKAQKLSVILSESLSFFAPEIMEVPRETLNQFVREEMGLHTYVHLIKCILREKEHILSPEIESIMAQYSEVTAAPSEIFKMINNADMKFGKIKNEKGEEVELTHGNYISFMESHDREVRKSAYSTLYAAYIKQKNTIAAAYNYNVKTTNLIAKLRNYDSALSAELYGDDIPEDVYTNLLDTVGSRLDVLHRYVDLRKRVLGVDKIHMYDMYVPLIEMSDQEMSYEECVEIVKAALQPLGWEYGENLERGFGEDWRWLDVYENEGKTSGAYSFGSYDSHPFVLLNFNGKKKYAFTIAHEMGHSMNSFYTRMYQPYIYGGHSIFTAEVASTVNEILLQKYLMDNAESVEEKKYLINIQLEEIRATVFRQTMFAEFEKIVHEASAKGISLTNEWLSSTYLELNKKYYGPDVEYDEEIAMEWARIPHFYTDFYVYKYATGYSAAIKIADRIMNEGQPAVDDYIEFLKMGDSDFPIELLKIAGVDMSRKEPIESAMDLFESLLDELESMI
ncbi:MAG: oligoendopeptidase F [Bacillota bacterium]|nr:oligoendopeptidase F [Bacillota bacterium]